MTTPLSPSRPSFPNAAPDPDAIGRAVIAIAAVAAVVCGIVALFRTADVSIDNGAPPVPLADVVMLPLEARDPRNPLVGRPDWMEPLFFWIIIRDPAFMSIPVDLDPLIKQYNTGFSQIRRREFERPHPPIASPDAVTLPYANLAYATPTVAPPIRQLVPHLETLRLHRPADLVVEPDEVPAVNRQGGVYITELDGAVASELPPIKASDVLAASAALRSSGPTVISILPQTNAVRVQLTRSCGNANLDRLAMSHLRLYAAHLRSLTVDPDNLKSWLDAEHQYQIFWRFVPGVQDIRGTNLAAFAEPGLGAASAGEVIRPTVAPLSVLPAPVLVPVPVIAPTLPAATPTAPPTLDAMPGTPAPTPEGTP